MNTICLDGHDTKINERQSFLTYSSLYDSYKPDPAWCTQDAKGHIHRWDLAAKKVHTIKTVVDETIEHYCDGDYWTEDITHQECIECGEHIEPGYLIDVPAGQLQSIPTLRGISGSFKLLENEPVPNLGEKYNFAIGSTIFETYIVAITLTDGDISIEFEG